MKVKVLSFLLVASFSISGFSQGFYMEYNITTDKGAVGHMKTYSQDGNSRSEISFSMAGGGASPFSQNTVILTIKGNGDKGYMLDEAKKTYSEMDISKSYGAKDDNLEDYQITVVGKEKVNGYNTTHVKIKNKKTNVSEEMWTTTEIPGYAELEKIKTKYTGTENLNKALSAKGAEGFPVKITLDEKSILANINLVKAEKKNNPASLFSLDGYAKSSGNDMLGGANMQQLMQQMQNMTPEERQKFIEQMKQQMGAPH